MIIVYTEIWNRKKGRVVTHEIEVDADDLGLEKDGSLVLTKGPAIVEVFALGQWQRARLLPELVIKNLQGEVIIKERLGTAKEDSWISADG